MRARQLTHTDTVTVTQTARKHTFNLYYGFCAIRGGSKYPKRKYWIKRWLSIVDTAHSTRKFSVINNFQQYFSSHTQLVAKFVIETRTKTSFFFLSSFLRFLSSESEREPSDTVEFWKLSNIQTDLSCSTFPVKKVFRSFFYFFHFWFLSVVAFDSVFSIFHFACVCVFICASR